MEQLKTIKEMNAGEAVKLLTSQSKGTPVEEILKQWEVKEHKIFDTAERPDKPIKNDKGQTERMEYVARIGLGLQKLIIRRAASFVFGNPVNIIAETEDNQVREQIVDSVKRIMRDNKITSFNRRMARDLFAFTEVAELWYPVQVAQKHETYGFSTRFKLKKSLFSPRLGDELFPLFDDNGDMVAFSRKYKKKETNQTTGKDAEVNYLTAYTPEYIVNYIEKNGQWEMDKAPVANILKKIPVVYARQDVPDWQDVQDLIERLEKLLSNFADTNDYHASPKIFVTGTIKGFSKKGEAGAIIEGEENSKAEYLSWAHAPESVRLEIETLTRMIYTLTQTPDIAFDSIRGIGNVSGVALKLLFMDAHLKVHDKMEVLEDYLLRRLNIIKAFMGKLNTSWEKEAENLEMQIEVIPYMVDDFKSEVELYMTATGGKAILSQETAVRMAGFVNDHKAEFAKIKDESEREFSFDVFGQAE